MRPASLIAAAPPSSCQVIQSVKPIDASANVSNVATRAASLVARGQEEMERIQRFYAPQQDKTRRRIDSNQPDVVLDGIVRHQDAHF